MARLLMPKATAVWLVENTALTFDQIADFCGLHPLQVKGIADGDVEQGIKGLDPVANGQLAAPRSTKAEKDPAYRLEDGQDAPSKSPSPRHGGGRNTRRSPSARSAPTRSIGFCATTRS